MAFPHRTAAFPHLVGRRALPPRPSAATGADGRRANDDGAGGAVAVGTARRTTVMDDSPRRRSGGRAARQAARLAAHVEHVPFLTRTLAPFEVLDEEGLVAHRAQRRHDPPGGRPRVPRRPRRAAPVPRGRRRRRRASASASRAGMCRADRPGDRAAPVHAVRAQPGAQRRDRRDAHGLRPELRLAVRPRPRRRPPLRHDRGLPQLREARLPVARTSTTPAARSASRSTCRSTSGTSTWSTRTCATATSRSWAR